jgi:hypothetical protein
MRTKWLLLFAILVWTACETTEQPPSLGSSPLVVGKWRLAAVQNESGTWESATEPTVMQINADGTIAYFDTAGNRTVVCCQPIAYRTEADKLVFTEWPACPAVRCALSPAWRIDAVTDQTLEATPEGQARRRYLRAR